MCWLITSRCSCIICNLDPSFYYQRGTIWHNGIFVVIVVCNLLFLDQCLDCKLFEIAPCFYSVLVQHLTKSF